ncbi:hypothetical protein HKD37_15G042823 [Glycine soja]
MSLEELVGTLKVHEQELQQNEGPKREKSLALNSQKNKNVLSSKEHVSRNSFKALKVDNSSNEESEENSDKDELPFISWKIRKMWKNKELKKAQDKKKHYKTKEKKGRMSIREDLDDTSSDEEEEKTNLCLMELENKLKDLQKDLKELNELHD